MPSTGWYLALRYMQGAGLVARVGEKLDPARRGAQFIFADRVLCRAANWREVLEDWWDALPIHGCLILWLPDCRYCEIQPGEAKLTLEDVTQALHHRTGWQLCEADLIDGYIYSVWRKHADGIKLVTPWRKSRKHMLISRTGAHGDALMAASILPYLKEKGWAITFISREAGCETLKADPHIDELILLSAGQVKEEELPYYWQAWAKRFDRFVNLTHSVEGELLKQPSRGDYFWPDDQRRKQCKAGYLGHIHKLARVPGPYNVRFYPTEREKLWAKYKAQEVRQGRCNPLPLAGRVRVGGAKLGPGLSLSTGKSENTNFVLWCLRGSAVHKWWPYGPQAICRLLAKTKLNFVLTGDAEAEPLARAIIASAEKYHGDANRIHSLVGTNTIREIMTLAHHANVVVGPETGVMNAVSLQPVPKVLLLSHSAPSNLPDDWVMTTTLVPETACYPCHRLHYTHEWCPQDATTGAAACAASIDTETLSAAVYEAWQNKTVPPWWVGDKRKTRA